MAEPRDELENTFLNDLGSWPFLLGMTDTATDGDWVWDSDGSSVDWHKWQSWGEPNGGARENCVVFARNFWDGNNGHSPDAWLDTLCESDPYVQSRPVNVICEREAREFT